MSSGRFIFIGGCVLIATLWLVSYLLPPAQRPSPQSIGLRPGAITILVDGPTTPWTTTVVDGDPVLYSTFVLPLMSVALLWVGGWTAAWLIRSAIRRRRGLCVGCGFSLYGLAEQTCPECGASISLRARSPLSGDAE